MSLVFETAHPLSSAVPERADVACFMGFVARRQGVPVPAAVLEQLDAAGWIKGPWRNSEDDDRLEKLRNLPVIIDGWTMFDGLFAWNERPVTGVPDSVSGGIAYCATYLGAAVRDFFLRGGKRAILISVGDPWPYLEASADRASSRRDRLPLLLPDVGLEGRAPIPFDPTEPGNWRGMHHVYGLSEASVLCLPDLPDICASSPIPSTVPPPLVPMPEGFLACSDEEAAASIDSDLRALRAPRLDTDGYAVWQEALATARQYLARYRRDVLLVAALPLPQVPLPQAVPPDDDGSQVLAHTDMSAFLRQIGALEHQGSQVETDKLLASAFVQLAYPWPRTASSSDLPEGLAPPDGILAGLLATNALTRGTFRSAAGDVSQQPLRDLADAEPRPSWGLGPGSPDAELARRVCLFAPMPGGWSLVSDVTTAQDEAWRFGGASRLMGTILRTARAWGEPAVLEPNGLHLWTHLRRSLEELLIGFWQAGALGGSSAAEAFQVRCGPDTMTQNDLDAGRLIVEISVRPALSVEQITLVLALANPGLSVPGLRSAF